MRRRHGRTRVSCPKCGASMQRGSLQRHLDTIHNEQIERYLCREVSAVAEFTVGVTRGRRNSCPVPGCGGTARDPFGMRRHFAFRHPRAGVKVAGEQQTVRCESCAMFVTDIKRHADSATCRRMSVRCRNERLADEQATADTVRFTINGEEIGRVRSFRYLGRILLERDDDSPCIHDQLARARRRWRDVARILKRGGADARAMAKFYLAIVQAVLLYGADSWTITKKDFAALERFHKRAVRHITGQHI